MLDLAEQRSGVVLDLDAALAGVSEATARLQKRGFIDYTRARIQVIDLQGLEAASCERHVVWKDEYDRLLPIQDAHAAPQIRLDKTINVYLIQRKDRELSGFAAALWRGLISDKRISAK